MRSSGAGGDGERDEVARYIVGVNRIQGGLAGELSRVNRAYASFRAAPTAPARQVAELRDAEQTLAVVTQQIEALEVPDGAARLHEELLRLLALQSAFARELTTARGVPAPAQRCAARPRSGR